MSSSTPPPNAPVRTGTHRTLTLVIVAIAAALVAGLLGLAVGGIGGTFLATGLGGASDSRVDQNISEGCAIIDRLEEDLPIEDGSFAFDNPLMFELGAAGNHFMAAGAGDPNGELWTAGNDLVAGTARLDSELTNGGLDQLEEICANA